MISDDKWGRKLAGVKADARAVNKKAKELKAESGALYHHKHDVAPTQEELVKMTYYVVRWFLRRPARAR
jgi:hypothetical protein